MPEHGRRGEGDQRADVGSSFFLASGMSEIYIADNSKSMIDVIFKGTAVRLFLNVEKLRGLTEMLNNYAREGTAVAKEVTGRTDASPSRASLMVHRLFCK
jgi:hypothetical protein